MTDTGSPPPSLGGALGALTRGIRKPASNGAGPYTPIGRTLATLGIDPTTMAVTLPGADQPTECLVIPLSELMFKEWHYLTGGGINTRDGGTADTP